MAASDPATDVPTPTGTLQGVAAFSWDGSAWQPSGRAGPSVATPTGVLRGVAAFNGGPAWQPAGLAQPGVATPTGTLDGVAVYTWTGDSWAPPGGTATPSTPHGALRGVAAFNWDGAAWQPASQAGPSVATPYGVLDGVAMFGWTGSAWAATGAPSLSLDFMTPGTLDPRITFTRASTATYFNSAGVMQTAATNAPRWDYNPSTLALNGLLIEEARTNLLINSGAVFTYPTSAGGGAAAPIVSVGATVVPDGTVSAAQLVFPSVSGAGAYSYIYGSATATANAYTFTVWLKGNVGGEQVAISVFDAVTTYYTTPALLTTSWQRFSVVTSNLTAAPWYITIGVDLRNAGQTAKPAQTIYVWGAQLEQGAFPTSYIPTTATAVTRSADQCSILPAQMGFYTPPGGSWMLEFIDYTPTSIAAYPRVVSEYPGPSNVSPVLIDAVAGPARLGQFDGTLQFTANTMTAGAVTKIATTTSGTTGKACLNGGAVASGPVTGGYAGIATQGVGIMNFTGAAANETVTGYLRRLRYWPRVLSDAEMQAVTI